MSNYTVTFKPENRIISVCEGTTLKEAITAEGLDFDFPCGGMGTCGKCRIKILDKNLKATEKELKFLEEKELKEGIHLACETKVYSDITVQLNQKKNEVYNILQSSTKRTFTIKPLIEKVYVEVDLPSLDKQKSDLKRLKEKLMQKKPNYKDIKMNISVLRELPVKLRQANHHITAVIHGNEIIGIEMGNTENTMLGVAFDIGTTTIVAYLMDLYTGKKLAVSSAMNPQIKFGADVISRTTFANQNENGVKLMQSTLLDVLNKLIEDSVHKANILKENIYAITIVGNTCMHHLFLGLTPKYIAYIPYVPVISETLELKSSDLNLHINPSGKVFVLPNIAGFVGADTVGVILASEMDKSKDVKLAIDIGTNGEIVLGSSKKLVSCSAAAGPAFEGAQISSGMRGAKGAIDHVSFGESLNYTVIGNEKPEGICGSALLDIVAGLVRLGIINKRGKLLSPDNFINPNALPFKNNIVTYEGANAFLIVPPSETAHGRAIMLTQNDITSLQLAKGAISAGISILVKKCNINTSDIKEVILAGAFGNYMDPHSACTIGLIPPELENKIQLVGNAAGTGSMLALLSNDEYEHSNTIASKVTYIELGAQKDFNREFAHGMQFQDYK
ncbi:ASKHA domain-containing protein [Clostridium coskatii]|uniref:Phenol hydroxylase P5 protein n=1 Tax=Clostridium coskatii TaxID=1705578 RepID=A0A166UM04_9CLOT|nr:ASKHA domain-containing protein [Clostridium coskatii]OAA95043.1 Phenol hydroxylase P5 protein [Clostridium coskatii]OBR94250.1 phenol hydroxylase P5 protein [Clostridium coskatii]